MKNLIILWAGLLCAFGGWAQSLSPEVVATSGHQGTSASSQLDWTVGEAIIETASSSSNVLTQGFHQPAYTITALAQPQPRTDIQLTAYPNPATHWVNLGISRENTSPVTVMLVDELGRVLSRQGTRQAEAELKFPISQLSQATYFLRVEIEGESFLETFKIAKIQ